MDDQGRLLPPGEAGEIVARGSLVTAGYHELPEATAEIRAHNWHHTGDIGYRDEDGFFYIVDRKKDMIISGGFNVYSAEVEAAIMALPQVHECAVIGVPDEMGRSSKSPRSRARGPIANGTRNPRPLQNETRWGQISKIRNLRPRNRQNPSRQNRSQTSPQTLLDQHRPRRPLITW